MDLRNLNILVTGGAGFIGSHLVDELLKENRVVILDDFSSGKRENIAHHEGNPNLRVVTGDVRNRELLEEITRDIDIVYHLAVRCLRESIGSPETTHEVNATGTLALLKASLAHSVRRFIYVSSSEVYGTAHYVPMDEKHPFEPTTVYGASKVAGELYTLAYQKTFGYPSMVVRPFNTYGPRSHFEGVYGEVIPRFVLRILNGKPPIIFGDGTQTRDFTFVADTVRGILLASQCDAMIGQAVNIARGREVSINDLASIIAQQLGRNDLSPIHERKRPGDVMRHYADISKATRLFGFVPDVDIEQGITSYIEWFRAQDYSAGELLDGERVFNW